MTKAINKGIDIILWGVLPLIILYFAALVAYKPVIIKWVEPLSVIQPVGDILVYKSHFVKFRELPGHVNISFTDERGNLFVPELTNDGRRNNSLGDNPLLVKVDISAFHPVGKVKMQLSVDYYMEFPFFTKHIPYRQETQPFCVRDSCEQKRK